MDHAGMGAAMHRHAEAAQPLGIGLAFVAEGIELAGMDIGRRQAGKFLGAQRRQADIGQFDAFGTYSSRSRARVSLSRK